MSSLSSQAVTRPPVESATGAMPGLRWLAERCGVGRALAPMARLASDLLRNPDQAEQVRAYLAWWLRHPDRGSTFESRSQSLQGMADAAALEQLAGQGYDGLIFLSGDEIAGHVFFQRRGTDLAAFSASVCDGFRGGRLWATFSLDFVAYAASLPGMRRVSVGTGKNIVARLLLKLMRPHQEALGWRTHDDGWIDFTWDE